MDRRYAIYYAPPADSALARFAAAWLGRCPEGYAIGPRPEITEFAGASLAAAVAEPARYGFHGTLKPPFRLAVGADEEALADAAAELSAGLTAFRLPPLRLEAIGRFIALVPGAPSPPLAALADACVTRLDRFRAPLTEGELARRRRARLSARQEALLARWGYPYVLDQFRFHLTLTGPLQPGDQERLMSELAPLVAPFCREPLAVADITLFVEPAPGAPLRLERRFALGPAVPARPVTPQPADAPPSS